MSKKVKRGRKAKFGEPLVQYSIMIRRDQREYLQERENASDWVREAIDEKIEREGGEVKAVDVVAVSKRITFLEQRIQALKKTPEYERAKYIVQCFNAERFKEMRDALTKGEKEMSFRRGTGLYTGGGLILGERGFFIPGWTMETLSEFVVKHKIETYPAPFPLEYALMIVDRMEEAFPYETKLVEGYEKRMAELKAEIEKLKEKITK